MQQNALGQMQPSTDNLVKAKQLSDEDFVIKPMVGANKIYFGMPIEKLKETLGEPERWTGRAYEYPSLGVTVIPGQDETVAAIMCGDASLPDSPLIKACKFRTLEGIGMGSSKEDIFAAYDKPSSTEQLRSRERTQKKDKTDSRKRTPNDKRYIRTEDANKSEGTVITLKYNRIRSQFVLRNNKVVHMSFRKRTQ